MGQEVRGQCVVGGQRTMCGTGGQRSMCGMRSEDNVWVRGQCVVGGQRSMCDTGDQRSMCGIGGQRSSSRRSKDDVWDKRSDLIVYNDKCMHVTWCIV